MHPTALSLRFFTPACADCPRSSQRDSLGRRVMFTVGQAAFSDSGSSSAPQRLPPRAVPVNRRPLVQSCPSSALVEPPSRTSHAPLTPHTRRVCFAVAQLGASPQASRLDTVHSCRARPCGRRCQRRCSWCVPTEKLPPRPLRPTLAAADRPVWAIFHLVVCRVLSRSTPASSSGGRLSFSVGLAAFSFSYSSSAPQRSLLRAALRNACAKHDPRTSSALVGPSSRSCQPPLPLHSRRVCFAAVPRRASPLASRLDTADSCRAWPCGGHCQRHCSESVPTEKLPPQPPRPTLAAADRPLAAIFHAVVCRLLVAAHTAVLHGRPAELLR
jgi:hypothetical protein